MRSLIKWMIFVASIFSLVLLSSMIGYRVCEKEYIPQINKLHAYEQNIITKRVKLIIEDEEKIIDILSLDSGNTWWAYESNSRGIELLYKVTRRNETL